MQKFYVTELQPADVLFGRGSGPNDHEGNVRFRLYVAERKGEYMATNHRLTKTKIAREIVDLILQENGRFLKKLEARELQELGLLDSSDCYEVVDDETVMEKAKQALRQNAAKVVRGGGDNYYDEGSGSGNVSPPPAAPPPQTLPYASATADHSSGIRMTQQQQQQQPPSRNAVAAQLASLTSLSTLYDLEPLPLKTRSAAAAAPVADINSGHRTAAASPPERAAARQQQQQQQHLQHLPAWEVKVPSMTATSDGSVPAIMQHRQQQISSGYGLVPERQQQQQISSGYGLAPDQRQQRQQQLISPGYGLAPEQQQQISSGYGLEPEHQQQQQRSQFQGGLVHNMQQQSQYAQPPVRQQQQQNHQFHLAQQQQQVQQQHRHAVSNPSVIGGHELSMAELPNEDDVAFDSRRASMTMSDLMKVHMRDVQGHNNNNNHHNRGGTNSMQQTTSMDDMMDSFSQLRTGAAAGGYHDYDQRRMMASTETMGTIEPLGSVADMSLGTMGSSTFSLFRGGDSLAVLDEGGAPSSLVTGVHSSPAASSSATTLGNSRSSKSSYESASSLSFADALFDGNRRKSSSLSASINGMLSEVRRQVESEYPTSVAPLTEEASGELDMEEMGGSSISVLKRAFIAEGDDDEDVVQIPSTQAAHNLYYSDDSNYKSGDETQGE